MDQLGNVVSSTSGVAGVPRSHIGNGVGVPGSGACNLSAIPGSDANGLVGIPGTSGGSTAGMSGSGGNTIVGIPGTAACVVGTPGSTGTIGNVTTLPASSSSAFVGVPGSGGVVGPGSSAATVNSHTQAIPVTSIAGMPVSLGTMPSMPFMLSVNIPPERLPLLTLPDRGITERSLVPSLQERSATFTLAHTDGRNYQAVDPNGMTSFHAAPLAFPIPQVLAGDKAVQHGRPVVDHTTVGATPINVQPFPLSITGAPLPVSQATPMAPPVHTNGQSALPNVTSASHAIQLPVVLSANESLASTGMLHQGPSVAESGRMGHITPSVMVHVPRTDALHPPQSESVPIQPSTRITILPSMVHPLRARPRVQTATVSSNPIHLTTKEGTTTAGGTPGVVSVSQCGAQQNVGGDLQSLVVSVNSHPTSSEKENHNINMTPNLSVLDYIFKNQNVETTTNKPGRPLQQLPSKVQTEGMFEVEEIGEPQTTGTFCVECKAMHTYIRPGHIIHQQHVIDDTPILSRARMSLPSCLRLEAKESKQSQNGADESLPVVKPREQLHKGARFGPVAGREVQVEESDNITGSGGQWIIFEDGKRSKRILCCDEADSNWLMFVRRAEVSQEQNLVAYQQDGHIYLMAVKDISSDKELMYWYSKDYAKLLGMAFKPEDHHRCTICLKQFTNSKSLEQHHHYSHPDMSLRKYKCNTCSKAFTCSAKLKTHVMAHIGVKPHKCQYCEKQFTDQSNLRMHLSIHTGEKKFQCEECGKTFRQKAHLNSHMFTHTHIKKLPCRHCFRMFSRPSDLRQHEYQHTKEHMIVCDVEGCKKVFYKVQNYKKHVKIHAGVRDFHCGECMKSFVTKYHLTRHIATCKMKKKKEAQSQDAICNMNKRKETGIEDGTCNMLKQKDITIQDVTSLQCLVTGHGQNEVKEQYRSHKGPVYSSDRDSSETDSTES